MAHVAQGLFVLFVVVALVLLVVRAGSAVVRVLYNRPLVLWLATAIAVPGALILTGRWRSVDWGGLGYFIVVAVVAFTGVALLCEGYRILKRLMETHR